MCFFRCLHHPEECLQKQADVKVKVKLDNGTLQPAPLTLQNTIYDQEGKLVATQSRSFDLTPQGVQSFEADFKIKNPTLWQGRKNPYLYKIVSRLIRNGKVIDEVVQPLGLRKYEIVAGEVRFISNHLPDLALALRLRYPIRCYPPSGLVGLHNGATKKRT